MIDLHTHSSVSDGSDAPSQVIELAARAGCSAVALTDHDRLDGITEARAAADASGIELVAGCELSCEHDATMHVLVYFLEPGHGPLQDELVRLQDSRDNRNQLMAERLQSLGLDVTYEQIQLEAGGIGAGRPHIAAILMRMGVVSSIQEAFDEWLAKGRPAYLPKERLEPSTAVALAQASGALAVLAHPLSMELAPAELESTVHELAGVGLSGIEAVYGRYSAEERSALCALADRAGLVVTGGSDYHGRYKPDLSIGTGLGDLDVPGRYLDDLKQRLTAVG